MRFKRKEKFVEVLLGEDALTKSSGPKWFIEAINKGKIKFSIDPETHEHMILVFTPMNIVVVRKEDYIVLSDSLLSVWNKESFETVFEREERPSVLYRPSLIADGNKWCALYGDNLHDGIAGFGDTATEAMAAFDVAFNTDIKKTHAGGSRIRL